MFPLNKLNRVEAVEVAAQVMKTYQGWWVEVQVYDPTTGQRDSRSAAKMLVPSLQAFTTSREVTFAFCFPYRSNGNPNTPVRFFPIKEAFFDEEDQRWFIGDDSGLVADFESAGNFRATHQRYAELKADPDLVALGTVAVMEAVAQAGTPIPIAEKMNPATRLKTVGEAPT